MIKTYPKEKKEPSIKIVRLSTGEEIMCVVEKCVSGNAYKLYRMGLIYPTKENQISIGPFVPYADLYATDGYIKVKDIHIIFMANPTQALIDFYKAAYERMTTPPPAEDNGITEGEFIDVPNEASPDIEITDTGVELAEITPHIPADSEIVPAPEQQLIL